MLPEPQPVCWCQSAATECLSLNCKFAVPQAISPIDNSRTNETRASSGHLFSRSLGRGFSMGLRGSI